MLPGQALQNAIDGIKAISHMDFCVMDVEGSIVAISGGQMDDCGMPAREFAHSMADSQEIKGHHYFKILDDEQVEYILVAEGAGEDSYTFGKLAAFHVQSLLAAYKEHFDRDNFIKNLLLDNLLLVDIHKRAKKLRINADTRRAVLMVEAKNAGDASTYEALKAFYIDSASDYVTCVDERFVVIVKALGDSDSEEEVDQHADEIKSCLDEAGICDVLLAYGTVVNEIKDVSRSYKEAMMAMDIGNVFFNDRGVIAYHRLGIGRLIYQLPLPLCKVFIREIFDSVKASELDEDLLETIHMFFDCSLNVSETARRLFIHRNTLVYRLDKLQRDTGLDIRDFDDAITLCIALMVVNYMRYMDSFEF